MLAKQYEKRTERMSARYGVRRDLDAARYTVWDHETNMPAIHNGRECTDLDFQFAFDLADDLNAQNNPIKERN